MQQLTAQHPIWFAVSSLLLAFTVIWIFGFVISCISGWRRLANRFLTDRDFPLHKRRFQSASMRLLMGYNNALTLASDVEGVYAGMTIFIPGHPRLFVPWTDVRVDSSRTFMWRTVRTLSLGPDAIPLTVREGTAQFLLEPRGDAATRGATSSTF